MSDKIKLTETSQDPETPILTTGDWVVLKKAVRTASRTIRSGIAGQVLRFRVSSGEAQGLVELSGKGWDKHWIPMRQLKRAETPTDKMTEYWDWPMESEKAAWKPLPDITRYQPWFNGFVQHCYETPALALLREFTFDYMVPDGVGHEYSHEQFWKMVIAASVLAVRIGALETGAAS